MVFHGQSTFRLGFQLHKFKTMDYKVNAGLDFKFSLRDSKSRAIVLRIYTGKEDVRDRISTGEKLPKGVKFNRVTCTEDRSVEARQVAARCRSLRSKVENALIGQDVSTVEKLKALTLPFKDRNRVKASVNDLFVSPESISLSKALKDYIQGISNGTIKTRKMTRFAEDTVRSYTLKIQNFLDYLEETGQDQPISNFDLSSTQLSAEKVEIRDRYNDLFEGFYEHLKDRDLKRRLDPSDTGLAVNSIAAIINKVKTGLTNRFDEYCYVQPKLKFSIPEEDSDTIVLPVEMMEILFASDEINPFELSRPHERAYNYIMFALSTTCRASDIYETTADHIRETNGELEFQKLTRKTNSKVNSYLYPVVVDLMNRNIERYGDAFYPLGRENTTRQSYVSNMAGTLKSFFRQFDCMHEVYMQEVRDSNTRELTIVKKPLYEMVATHTMRRTSITYMQIMGMSDADIKRMSGHTKNSKSYEKYKRFVPSAFRSNVQNYIDRLSQGNLVEQRPAPDVLKVIRDERGAA